ncbi:MAG: EAL domain-containing protein [Thiolinea sp.]
MYECGKLLLAYLNSTNVRGGFALIEIVNIHLAYSLGGAQSNVKIWQQATEIIRRHLPRKAYMGRVSPGFAIHCWGKTVDRDLKQALYEIQLELESLTLERPSAELPAHIKLASRIGYLIYPDDMSYRHDSFEILSRYTALTAMGFRGSQIQSSLNRYHQDLSLQAELLGFREYRIHQAILNRQFDIHLQPKVNLQDGRMMGAEALARWDDDILGTVATEDFIPLIEKSSAVIGFTELILDKTIAFLSRHQAQFPPGFRCAVNLPQSIFNWRENHIPALVYEALERHHCPARYLEIEITESAYFAREITDQVVESIRELQQGGISITIDDFGSGYGALSLITSNLISQIKIDKDTTRRILQQQDENRFLDTLIFAATHSGIGIIVEGLDTPSQAEFFRERHIPYAQGYLYSPALPESEFVARFLRSPLPPDMPGSNSG